MCNARCCLTTLLMTNIYKKKTMVDDRGGSFTLGPLKFFGVRKAKSQSQGWWAKTWVETNYYIWGPPAHMLPGDQSYKIDDFVSQNCQPWGYCNVVSNASVALKISFHSPFGPLEFGISNLYLLTYMGVKNLGRPTAHTTHLLTPLCFDDDRQVQTKQAGKRPRNIAPDMLSA